MCLCLLGSELLPQLRPVVLTACFMPNQIETRCFVSVFFSHFSILFCSVWFYVSLCPSNVRIFQGRVQVETVGWLHFPFFFPFPDV